MPYAHVDLHGPRDGERTVADVPKGVSVLFQFARLCLDCVGASDPSKKEKRARPRPSPLMDGPPTGLLGNQSQGNVKALCYSVPMLGHGVKVWIGRQQQGVVDRRGLCRIERSSAQCREMKRLLESTEHQFQGRRLPASGQP